MKVCISKGYMETFGALFKIWGSLIEEEKVLHAGWRLLKVMGG